MSNPTPPPPPNKPVSFREQLALRRGQLDNEKLQAEIAALEAQIGVLTNRSGAYLNLSRLLHSLTAASNHRADLLADYVAQSKRKQ